jgi:hypothetical protein
MSALCTVTSDTDPWDHRFLLSCACYGDHDDWTAFARCRWPNLARVDTTGWPAPMNDLRKRIGHRAKIAL